VSEPAVGGRLPAFTMQEVSLEQIVGLMELMQDTNPVHVDAELAARLGLRGPVAQGPASLAYVINMLLGWRGDAFLERLEFRFEDTVTLGDTATARGVVQEVDGERVTCRFSLGLQTGMQALSGVATVRVPGAGDAGC
jgi:3-hydroxybutyryl-CoA dehydratase